MTMKPGCVAALVIVAAWLPMDSSALDASNHAEMSSAPVGHAFTDSAAAMVDASGATPPIQNNLAPANPASKLCADGTRAIDQGRWADAVKIFSQVARQHSDHADAALYWKAYAENKLGEAKASQNSCAELRSGYPKSRWVDDCGALEVEIRAKSGKPVEIDPAQSDDVKLLALNLMLRQDEPRALAEIQEILNGDSSEKLKKEAEFILGNHYSDTTYAQIVRISYVEGDVRIQRGNPTGKPNGANWEKAIANLPVETGFSLATGQGRAEIEFENASTIYLGENSVLTFNDLHETAGVPFTELGLLSGTVSLYFRPYTPWEKLVLHTPTNDLVSRYPDKSYARIEAFSDAVTITPLPGGDVRLPGVAKDAAVAGRTWTYVQGQLLDAEGEVDKQASSTWDQWVEDRMSRRTAAISAVMAASGLTAPIPGLVEMNGQGKFFDCAPYGTCWEPADQAEDRESANTQSNREPRFELAAYHPVKGFSRVAQNTQNPASSPLAQTDVIEREYRFPCTPEALLYRMAKDPATGKYVRISAQIVHDQPYSWAVCHAGSWIRHRRHYAWVVGGKRRHIDPVRWVKSGRHVGFIPLHPYDVKGRPAINAKNEFFAVNGKEQIIVEPVKFDAGRPIAYLKTPPREYRDALLRPLAPTEVPRMETHAFPKALPNQSGKGTVASRATIPIRFDAKTLSFNVLREEMRGGKPATVYAPMTNHSGSLQARGESFVGGSGFHGGSATSSGGGFHGSSSGSSSSGGGHAGATASTSSSASAASGAASHH